MLIYVIAIILAMSYCCSAYNNQRKSPIQQRQVINNGIFPGNYTLREIVEVEFNAFNIMFSPDQNWIVYQNSQSYQSFTTTFYYRHRRQLQATLISIDTQTSSTILKYLFNKKGNLLFIATLDGYIYVCHFSANMTSQDCQIGTNISLQSFQISLSINEGDQLVLGNGNQIDVFSVSKTGELNRISNTNYIDTRWSSVMWHPKLSDIVVVGTCSYNTDLGGFIYFYNITSKQSKTSISYYCIVQLVVFETSNIIITVNEFEILTAYTFNDTSARQINITANITLAYIQLSKDQTLLTGFHYDQAQMEVYSLEVLTPTRPTNPQSFLYASPEALSLKLVHQRQTTGSLFAFSIDSNEYIIVESFSNLTQLKIYSMCPRGTYYATNGCLTCSKNCSTCHLASDVCTNCPSNAFALLDNSCQSCNSYLPGCLACSSASFCLLCDANNNWNSFPANGSCSCQDFYFISQGKCKPCDSSGVCRVCQSQNNCKQCDLYKGYKLRPINSTCLCRKQFSTVNNICVECDIDGCERCEQANVCLSCSQENGYEPNVGSYGKCVRKNSDSITIILLIIGGILILAIIIYIFCKFKGKIKTKKSKLNQELYFEGQSNRQSRQIERQSRQIRRQRAPRFEEFEEMLRQSIRKSLKIDQPIAAINKKEYAKFSDEQKIRLRQLLKQSLVQNE